MNFAKKNLFYSLYDPFSLCLKYQIIVCQLDLKNRIIYIYDCWMWSTKSCRKIPDIAYSQFSFVNDNEAMHSDPASLGILSQHWTFIHSVQKVENDKHNERTKIKLVLGLIIFSCESSNTRKKIKAFVLDIEFKMHPIFFLTNALLKTRPVLFSTAKSLSNIHTKSKQ